MIAGKRWPVTVVVAVQLVIGSCQDMGREVLGGSSGLTATPASVFIEAGDDEDVVISGGSVPYTIAQAPNASVASAQLVNPSSNPATLSVTANASAGIGNSTSVIVRDNSTPPLQVAIVITITDLSLVANPSLVTVGSGQHVNVTISNGTPPYIIDDAPSSNLASAAFVDANVTPATLTITGANNPSATGTTRVKIKDSRPSPEREIRVEITKVP